MTDSSGNAQGLGIDNFTFSASVTQSPMNIQVSGTNVLLSWPTTVGVNYQLEYNNNLNTSDWIPLGNSVSRHRCRGDSQYWHYQCGVLL